MSEIWVKSSPVRMTLNCVIWEVTHKMMPEFGYNAGSRTARAQHDRTRTSGRSSNSRTQYQVVDISHQNHNRFRLHVVGVPMRSKIIPGTKYVRTWYAEVQQYAGRRSKHTAADSHHISRADSGCSVGYARKRTRRPQQSQQ